MDTSLFISPNALAIECRIKPNGGTTQNLNPFGTQQQLQGRKVVAIEVVSTQDTLYSPISSGNPIIPPNVFRSSFLRLYTASTFNAKGELERPEGLYYDLIPLPILRRSNNYDITPTSVTSGTKDLFRIRPTEIAWTKASVLIPNPVSLSQEYSAVFIIHYLDEGDNGDIYRMH